MISLFPVSRFPEKMVVCKKNNNDEIVYLDGEDNWTRDINKAWPYQTNVAFAHAEEFGGEVRLVIETEEEPKEEVRFYSKIE